MSSAFLVISNRRSILLADLHQQSLERVSVAFENVVATASDMANKTIFWSDMKLKKIFKLEEDQKPVEVCVMNIAFGKALVLPEKHILCLYKGFNRTILLRFIFRVVLFC